VDSGPGFQIFHFNGSSLITHYSAVLQPGISFQQFAWDGDNHLYALGGGELSSAQLRRRASRRLQAHRTRYRKRRV
jgi:hypothetical protein